MTGKPEPEREPGAAEQWIQEQADRDQPDTILPDGEAMPYYPPSVVKFLRQRDGRSSDADPSE